MGQAIRAIGYGPAFVAGGIGLLLLALWARDRFARLSTATRAA
jgi:hypothetical protein